MLFRSFFTGIKQRQVKGRLDYLDAHVFFGRSDQEFKSFGGMSGGGLWRVPLVLFLKKSTKERRIILNPKQKPALMGVCFYQKPVRGNRGFVRCHGWKSIYGIGMDRLRP